MANRYCREKAETSKDVAQTSKPLEEFPVFETMHGKRCGVSLPLSEQHERPKADISKSGESLNCCIHDKPHYFHLCTKCDEHPKKLPLSSPLDSNRKGEDEQKYEVDTSYGHAMDSCSTAPSPSGVPNSQRMAGNKLLIQSDSFKYSSYTSKRTAIARCAQQMQNENRGMDINEDHSPSDRKMKDDVQVGSMLRSVEGCSPASSKRLVDDPTGYSKNPLFDRSKIVQQRPLLDGTKISDYYQLSEGHIGKGSYGYVVKARDLRTDAIRAVKVVFKPRIENLARLKREILILKELDHPNIIKLLEVYEDAENLFLVMGLCTGGELFDRIIKSRHFSEMYAATLMKQMFSACAYCHSNDVMHRDLKPENLIFADPSPQSSLKVIDWGFASKCGRSHKCQSVVGTPYYVAPEVLHACYDKRCDLWSAGVIMFILLCGYPPFHGKDNQTILTKVKIGSYQFDPNHWKNVSESAKDLVKKCLAFNPDDRITAQQALAHPWIESLTNQGLTQEIELTTGEVLLDMFRSFQAFNKMKRLAVTCVAYQLTDREIGALHKMFVTLDNNGDGVLTVSEVQQGLAKLSVHMDDTTCKLLEDVDTNGNGTIDYTEFLAACIDRKLYDQESVCAAAFAVFDLDGDGRITNEELRMVLEMNFVQEAFDGDLVTDMIKEVDVNKDGSIDFEEFMRMMRGKQAGD